ncbi:hypothetical protein [Hymenobacter weizhouensis]|uniref:hypothetical protein n=1 Tax=Hymenobacter sp. YIM 151500-1 TaxID=2987689 RepID=UPI00222669E4|nr:hypothetical protein [Hymenobacter sp. YIM 151500-1]UYZ63058.1 hypothetical protein OIS53_18945 [Hymenobacter sp. YIM 151500-1]
MTATTGAAWPLRDVPAVGTGAVMTVILGGTLGLALLLVPPVFGLIYRHDRPVFQQMMQPRYGVSVRRPAPPPYTWRMLRQLAQWLLGLGLLAEAAVRLWPGPVAGWPPGLLAGLGAFISGCALAGVGFYLYLRDGSH